MLSSEQATAIYAEIPSIDMLIVTATSVPIRCSESVSEADSETLGRSGKRAVASHLSTLNILQSTQYRAGIREGRQR